MSKAKLTAEWCEAEAKRRDALASASSFAASGYHADRAELARLAARAIRLREHLSKYAGCDAGEPGCNGGCGVEHIGVVLAILDGREP